MSRATLSRLIRHLYCQYLTSSIDVPDARNTKSDKKPANPPSAQPKTPPIAMPRKPILTLYKLPVIPPADKYSTIDDLFR